MKTINNIPRWCYVSCVHGHWRVCCSRVAAAPWNAQSSLLVATFFSGMITFLLIVFLRLFLTIKNYFNSFCLISSFWVTKCPVHRCHRVHVCCVLFSYSYSIPSFLSSFLILQNVLNGMFFVTIFMLVKRTVGSNFNFLSRKHIIFMRETHTNTHIHTLARTEFAEISLGLCTSFALFIKWSILIWHKKSPNFYLMTLNVKILAVSAHLYLNIVLSPQQRRSHLPGIGAGICEFISEEFSSWASQHTHINYAVAVRLQMT